MNAEAIRQIDGALDTFNDSRGQILERALGRADMGEDFVDDMIMEERAWLRREITRIQAEGKRCGCGRCGR